MKVLLAIVLVMAGCSVFRNDPWEGKLYIGDAKQGAVVRSQDDEVIPATDPKFEGLVCMSGGDFKDLVTKYREARVNCPAPEPSAAAETGGAK